MRHQRLFHWSNYYSVDHGWMDEKQAALTDTENLPRQAKHLIRVLVMGMLWTT